MVSSTVGCETSTGWNRRSSAASFSMRFLYSSSVVAPMHRSSPRAMAGLSRLAASFAPSAAPAPTMVCSSSMKRMSSPSAASTSLITAFNRSSNSPRNLAPATSAPMSRAHSRLFFSDSGTSPRTMRWAMPSTAWPVLPTTPRLADEHRVVLRPAREHLHHAPDLLVPADDRVDLALARGLGEVPRVLVERLELPLRILVGDALGPADAGERPEELLVRDAARLREERLDLAVVLRHREQVVLHGDEVVLELLRLVLRLAGDLQRAPRQPRLGPAGDARERLHLAGDRRLELRHVRPRLAEQRSGDATLLLQHDEQQVLGRKLRIARARGATDGVLERFAALGGHPVGTHGSPLVAPGRDDRNGRPDEAPRRLRQRLPSVASKEAKSHDSSRKSRALDWMPLRLPCDEPRFPCLAADLHGDEAPLHEGWASLPRVLGLIPAGMKAHPATHGAREGTP